MTFNHRTTTRDLFVFQSSLLLDHEQNTPEAARDIVIDWLNKKMSQVSESAAPSLERSWSNTTLSAPEASVESIVGVTENGAQFWAAKLDHIATDDQNRRFITEVTIGIPSDKQTAELGLRLSVQDTADTATLITPSIPVVVRNLVKDLALYADGKKLNSSNYVNYRDNQQGEEIAELILSKKRTKPVILATYAPKTERNSYHSFSRLFERTQGAAHVFICGDTTLEIIQDRLGTPDLLPAGHLRFFRPGFTEGEGTSENPILSYLFANNKSLPDVLVKLVTQASVRLPHINDIAPHFVTVKQFVRRIKKITTEADPAESKRPQIAALFKPAETQAPEPVTQQPEMTPETAASTTEPHQQLATAAQDIKDLNELLGIADGTIRGLEDEVADLRAQLKTAEKLAKAQDSPSILTGKLYPDSAKELRGWIDVYAPHLAIHEDTVDALEKTGHRRISEIFHGLAILNTHLWPTLMCPDERSLQIAWRNALKDPRFGIPFEDTKVMGCGMNSTKARAPYIFTFHTPDGKTHPHVFMDRHLARSVGNRETAVRIYYSNELLEADGKPIPVGCIHKHLPVPTQKAN